MVKEFGMKAMREHGHEEPFSGPLKVWIKCIMPLPKSAHRKRTPVPEKCPKEVASNLGDLIDLQKSIMFIN